MLSKLESANAAYFRLVTARRYGSYMDIQACYAQWRDSLQGMSVAEQSEHMEAMEIMDSGKGIA